MLNSLAFYSQFLLQSNIFPCCIKTFQKAEKSIRFTTTAREKIWACITAAVWIFVAVYARKFAKETIFFSIRSGSSAPQSTGNWPLFSPHSLKRPNWALDRRTILCLFVPGFQRQVFKLVPKCKRIPLTKLPRIPSTNICNVNFLGTLVLLRVSQRANISSCLQI